MLSFVKFLTNKNRPQAGLCAHDLWGINPGRGYLEDFTGFLVGIFKSI